MRRCPRCGSETADFAPYCPLCGMPFKPPQSPSQQREPPAVAPHKTVIGMAPQPEKPAHRDARSATMVGIAPDPQPQQPAQQVPQAHRTMIGMPELEQAPTQPPPAVHQTVVGVAPPPEVPLPTVADAKRTMFGMPPPSEPPQPQQAHHPTPPSQPSAHQTRLGVALPGIAPIHPGQPGPAAAPSQAQHTMLGVARPGIAPVRSSEADVPYAPRFEPEPAPASPHKPKRVERARAVVPAPPLYRRAPFVIALVGVVVAIGILAFAVLWRPAPLIGSQVAVNDKGRDVLRLSCEACPDGTVAIVKGVRASMASGQTEVVLPESLNVGQNRLDVELYRPGAEKQHVELVIPVAFRIRPDLAQLASTQPRIIIDVEAVPGSRASIDNTPLPLDANGRAQHVIDVLAECTGQRAEVALLERDVSYSIEAPGKKADAGTVNIKVGITPLVLQAPRPRTVTAEPSFAVGGRSAKGAEIDIEGTKFASEPSGAFSRKLRVERAGISEVRVRATAPDHASRVVSFTVKRVASLEEEAKAFAKTAPLAVHTLMADTVEHTGQAVALEGEIVEARAQGLETIMLLTPSERCSDPPCLIRLIAGPGTSASKGDKVRVFGHVAGAHETGTRQVPEVDVAFLLRGRR